MIEKFKLKNKFILDACCGLKQMWLNKNHPNAVYIDIRKEEKGFVKQRPNTEINPDFIMDFRRLEFPDKSFRLIVWDPPHLKTLGETSIFRKKFGCLNAETWAIDMKNGFNELWRVLVDYGVLIFKWSDNEISFRKILMG